MDEELYDLTAKQLLEGLQNGFDTEISGYSIDEINQEMVKHFEDNVRLFSGFKSAAQLQAARNALFDQDGKLKSFSKFKQAALEINESYNKTYLKAEYNTVVASGQNAKKWQAIQADKEVFPYLQYQTVGDDQVRDSHRLLDGIIKPVDDPFWKTYMPPNDWQCRCSVVRLRRAEATNIEGLELPSLKEQFNRNPANEQQAFDLKKHPYRKGLKRGTKRSTSKAVNELIKRNNG